MGSNEIAGAADAGRDSAGPRRVRVNDALDALQGSLVFLLVLLVGAGVLLLTTPEELLPPGLKAARRSFVPVLLQRWTRQRAERAVRTAEEAVARLEREAQGTRVEGRDSYRLAFALARGARRRIDDDDNPAAALKEARLAVRLVGELMIDVGRAKASPPAKDPR